MMQYIKYLDGLYVTSFFGHYTSFIKVNNKLDAHMIKIGMSLRALSRLCQHPGGLVKFIDGADDMSEHIVAILKPPHNGP